MKGKIWLRAETKRFEKRTPLIPKHAEILVKDGFEVIVEHSNSRVYSDQAYLDAGCFIAKPGGWEFASRAFYVLGIKELESKHFPLKHRHIYFAHAYKHQQGSEELLERFNEGHGLIYDYEYMTDSYGHHVMTRSFSEWAGYVGAAIGLLVWCEKQLSKSKLTIMKYSQNRLKIEKKIMSMLEELNVQPKTLIIGANGKSGQGAKNFFRNVNIAPDAWTRVETGDIKSMRKIFNYDILVNCVLVKTHSTPFFTKEDLVKNNKLSVISDVSCDVGGPNNMLPIYEEVTTFDNPIHKVWSRGGYIDIIAIDHLPTFFAQESSDDFSEILLPYLQGLLKGVPAEKLLPWHNAENKFFKVIDNAKFHKGGD